MTIGFSDAEYEFIDKVDAGTSREQHILVFLDIDKNWIARYKKSIQLWLRNDYGIEYYDDYDFTETDYGARWDDHCSIAVWFKDPEHFVMLKLAHG